LGTLGEESWLTIVIQLKQRSTTFDLGLDKTWCCHFEEIFRGKDLTEGGEEVGAKAEYTRCIFSAKDKMAKISLDGRIRFL